MNNDTIKAIIFDCYNVLVSDGSTVYFEKYLADKPDVYGTYYKYEDEFNAGDISYDEFLVKASRLGGTSVEDARKLYDNNPINDELFLFITEHLKPNYKIGFLSNAGGDWVEDTIGKENKKLFDVIVLSYNSGYIKPQPEIYKLTADRLGVKPEECIMIDDRAKYCEGARRVGMRAIQYASVDQVKQELGL